MKLRTSIIRIIHRIYFYPSLVLVIGFGLIYSFILSDWDIWKLDNSTANLIASMGLVFTIFQLFLTNAVQKAKDISTLRHTEYKEFSKLLNSISETIHTTIVEEDLSDFKTCIKLGNTLMNKTNEVRTFIVNNSTYLFEGLGENEVTIELSAKLDSIVFSVSLFASTIKAAFKSSENLGDTNSHKEVMVVDKMEFQKSLNDHFKAFNKLKHPILRVLQKYVK